VVSAAPFCANSAWSAASAWPRVIGVVVCSVAVPRTVGSMV
jgi:hypothetical protein